MAEGRPTGPVAFLFTDVEGSTRAWRQDPAAMARWLEEHDRLAREVFTAHRGYVFSTAGTASRWRSIRWPMPCGRRSGSRRVFGTPRSGCASASTGGERRAGRRLLRPRGQHRSEDHVGRARRPDRDLRRSGVGCGLRAWRHRDHRPGRAPPQGHRSCDLAAAGHGARSGSRLPAAAQPGSLRLHPPTTTSPADRTGSRGRRATQDDAPASNTLSGTWPSW